MNRLPHIVGAVAAAALTLSVIWTPWIAVVALAVLCLWLMWQVTWRDQAAGELLPDFGAVPRPFDEVVSVVRSKLREGAQQLKDRQNTHAYPNRKRKY